MYLDLDNVNNNNHSNVDNYGLIVTYLRSGVFIQLFNFTDLHFSRWRLSFSPFGDARSFYDADALGISKPV